MQNLVALLYYLSGNNKLLTQQLLFLSSEAKDAQAADSEQGVKPPGYKGLNNGKRLSPNKSEVEPINTTF